MTASHLSLFLKRLRQTGGTEGCGLTDAQLLERFSTNRDEAAFEVLVWRHGPLVSERLSPALTPGARHGGRVSGSFSDAGSEGRFDQQAGSRRELALQSCVPRCPGAPGRNRAPG